MAVKHTSKSKKTGLKGKREISLPLEKENFIIIGLGIIVLVIGYILMSGNSVDGFLPTVISPILLVLGYCVIIPYGILKKPKKREPEIPHPAENISSSPESVMPNVKTK
jgi:Protein of unknown function (DUF3098)